VNNELFDGRDGPTGTVTDTTGSPIPDSPNISGLSNSPVTVSILVALGVFLTYPLRLGITSATGLPIAGQTGLGLWTVTTAASLVTYLALRAREDVR
jgi:hypothetical protein